MLYPGDRSWLAALLPLLPTLPLPPMADSWMELFSSDEKIGFSYAMPIGDSFSTVPARDETDPDRCCWSEKIR